MEQVSVARAIAVIAHRFQKYGKRDYFNAHVLEVATETLRLTQGDSDTLSAAYLHDVIEDTDITWAELKKAGISNRVCIIVMELTRREDETYEEYIRRVKDSSFEARQVKLADLTVNMRNKPRPELMKRYTWAHRYLKGKV